MLVVLFAGCAPLSPATQAESLETGALPPTLPSESTELIVFAAASLTNAFDELGILYEAAHPNVTVIFNFAGSQQLAQQIYEGAPADVFASANRKQMDTVIEAGVIAGGTEKTFVTNRLLVIYPKDNPAGLQTLADLANSGLKLIFAIREVPVGQYTLNFLDKANAEPEFGEQYKDNVLANVVSYEENVKAVLSKVALGEADAGIVYASDITGENAALVGTLDIPDSLNVIAAYPIAPVSKSNHPALAQAFIDLVLSQEGQTVLAKYKFVPVK